MRVALLRALPAALMMVVVLHVASIYREAATSDPGSGDAANITELRLKLGMLNAGVRWRAELRILGLNGAVWLTVK